MSGQLLAERYQILHPIGEGGMAMVYLAKDLRTAGEVAAHLKLNMPGLKQAVAYWADASGKLGGSADHTEIFRYAEMLAERDA